MTRLTLIFMIVGKLAAEDSAVLQMSSKTVDFDPAVVLGQKVRGGSTSRRICEKLAEDTFSPDAGQTDGRFWQLSTVPGMEPSWIVECEVAPSVFWVMVFSKESNGWVRTVLGVPTATAIHSRAVLGFRQTGDAVEFAMRAFTKGSNSIRETIFIFRIINGRPANVLSIPVLEESFGGLLGGSTKIQTEIRTGLEDMDLLIVRTNEPALKGAKRFLCTAFKWSNDAAEYRKVSGRYSCADFVSARGLRWRGISR